ncbi:MAG: DegT/DnrJ/EryC1/StrS family aminotransferase [Elusimicrobiota bacterium]
MKYSIDPPIELKSFIGPSPSWEELDHELSKRLRCRAVAVPSVRVGMLWMLEHLGLRRHESEVLVPRYVGRCILDALGRAALPALSLGIRTRAAVVVHSFGLEPDWEKLRPSLSSAGVPFIEDAPHGLMEEESCGEGSLGKFIALSKLLPMLKGGCFVPQDESLAEFMRQKRSESGPIWIPWWILMTLAPVRRGRHTAHCVAAESAYSVYPYSPSDNGPLRRNFREALRRLDEYSDVEVRRLGELRSALGARVIVPHARRLIYGVPILADGNSIEEDLSACGFCAERYTMDMACNMLSPRYEKVFWVPVHPGVREDDFHRLLDRLSVRRDGMQSDAA